MGKRSRFARLRFAGAASALTCVLVMVVLAGCGPPSIVSTGTTTTTAGPTTKGAGSTTATTAPSTAATPGTVVPPSTSTPVSSFVSLHWLNVSFVAPSGWTVSAPIRGTPQDGCVRPVQPAPDTPSWFGCPGVWVIPWTSDPSKPAAGNLTPGEVWFMSTGSLPCPYQSSRPNNVVFTPGTLVDEATRTFGGVAYRWYEWSATCNLNGTSGAPVTHAFDAQVWWSPSAGIAFTDVADHPEITGILDSVQHYVPPPTTTTTAPATSTDFHSPTGNINCDIRYGPGSPDNMIRCTTFVPPQSVTLSPNGSYGACSGASCLAGASQAPSVLPYGLTVGRGPFLCDSTISGMICTVNGKGFEISRSGVAPA